MNLTDMEARWFATMAQEWNNHEIKRITNRMTNVKTVVDIGACAGFSVNHWLKSLNPDLIVAFEPEARNFEIMGSMVKKTDKIKLEPFGIYYGQDHCKVSHCSDGNPGGRFMEIFSGCIDKESEILEDSDYVLVALEDRIDFVPDLIKIDVEGAEYNIIEHSSIVKLAKYLYIEWHIRSECEIEEFVKEHLSDYVEMDRDSRDSVLFVNRNLVTCLAT